MTFRSSGRIELTSALRSWARWGRAFLAHHREHLIAGVAVGIQKLRYELAPRRETVEQNGILRHGQVSPVRRQGAAMIGLVAGRM